MQEERARGKSTLALENPRIRVAIRAGQSYIAPQAALAQLVRALDCGSRGPPFEPGRRYHPKSYYDLKSIYYIKYQIFMNLFMYLNGISLWCFSKSSHPQMCHPPSRYALSV